MWKNQNHTILVLAAYGLLGYMTAACAPRSDIAVQPTQTSNTQAAASTLAGAAPDGVTAPVEAVTATDCQPGSCDPVSLVVHLVDMTTGGDIDELKGFSKEQVTWGLKVSPEGPDDGRTLLIRVDTAPEDIQVARKANTVVLIGTFNTVTSGSINVVYRDVSYCKAQNGGTACDDITANLSKFDKQKAIAYRILQGTQDEANAEVLQQNQALKSQQDKQNCLAGLFGVFMGNIGGVASCVVN